MDPIAHSLAGATLAQTGLKKLTPLATATLVIGANLSDVDAVVTFLGQDASLFFRRGITHGIIALIALPLLLTGVMTAYDRFVRRRRDPHKLPVNIRGLLVLSYIGVLSHPFLDWLNTYGVRLLMPFDGRWFYGDTLFIIDAWMWLLMGAAVIFAHSHTRLSQTLWILLGVATSVLVTAVDIVPVGAKIVWWLCISVIIALRTRGVRPHENQWIAVLCVVTFCIYLSALAFGNSRAHDEVKQWVKDRHGATVTKLMTGPVPANPFYREVLAVSSTHYYGLMVRVIGGHKIVPLYEPVRIESPNHVVTAALGIDAVRGFVNWMRFPTYEVRPRSGGYQVIIRDLRYVRPDAEPGPGIGIADVFVQSDEIRASQAYD
jgi:inner membrane protein